MVRSLVASVGAAAALAVLAAPAGARSVDVSAPLYESPGGTVPTIVTVHRVASRSRVEISARGTGGSIVTCVGDVWVNRLRRTASRKCYQRLPLRAGRYRVIGRARIVAEDGSVTLRSGTGRRPVLASGFPSRRPMSLAEIARIEACHNDGPHVWLTFDDGGSPQQVRRILRTLRRNDARGRFFFTGAWGREHPALLRRIAASGHLIGNHSSTHAALSAAPSAEVVRQIRSGTTATTSPRLLRPPFAAGALTTRLRTLASAQGYDLCRWTVDTYDWHGVSAARMAERVRHGDELTPPVAAGGNILMHGTGRHTSTGLQQIIDAVRARRLTLEPLR